MERTSQGCPICRGGVTKTELPDATSFRCANCGDFWMTRTLVATLKEPDYDLLPYLRCYVRQANERGITPKLGTENWKDFAYAHSRTPVSNKLTKTLELIESRSRYPGDEIAIDYDHDFPLIDAVSSDELAYLLDALDELHYIKPSTAHTFTMTVKGWEQLRPKGGGKPGSCFIAMSFDSSLTDAYENGFCLAVKDCGYEPIRIDRIPHNEDICDKIIAEVRQCQFMVADFTLQRAGVYFEAGFATGLGRPVIWTCREDDFKNVHFDTRQYNHIVWQTPADLRGKLADRIRATILK